MWSTMMSYSVDELIGGIVGYDTPTRKTGARVLQLPLNYKLVQIVLKLDEPIVECV